MPIFRLPYGLNGTGENHSLTTTHTTTFSTCRSRCLQASTTPSTYGRLHLWKRRANTPKCCKSSLKVVTSCRPPDLFVETLDRKLMEDVVADLIQRNGLRHEWLCSPNKQEYDGDQEA